MSVVLWLCQALSTPKQRTPGHVLMCSALDMSGFEPTKTEVVLGTCCYQGFDIINVLLVQGIYPIFAEGNINVFVIPRP